MDSGRAVVSVPKWKKKKALVSSCSAVDGLCDLGWTRLCRASVFCAVKWDNA